MFSKEKILSIKLYEVDHEYIDYLAPFAPHLFHNKKQELHTRTNELFTELVATTAQIPIDPSLAEACDKGKIEGYKTDYLDQMIEKI